ncbi:WD40-repeat-containing domain protein [Sporodiniella umbellata]|nr:WD40-repeat-containing domain protein [Sporodiniella umbellata]
MAVDPFFASARKRKRSNNKASTKKQTPPKTHNKRDSDIEGDSDDDDHFNANSSPESAVESSDEEIEETAAEKRVRLAKAYLNNIEKDAEGTYRYIQEIGTFDAADLDRDLVAERLKKDDDESEGRLHLRVADKYNFKPEDLKSHRCRGHQLTVTAVALSENGNIFYSASKDGSIIKWDVKANKKLHTFIGGRKGVKNYNGHTDHILCLAISHDGKYLASGGRDKIINIWSGLAFRKGSNQLYSASHDRTIKVWNIDEKSYIETLFGHQDQITDIDTLGRERCVSTGGRDKTARLWKIVEESQLVFRGGISTKDESGAKSLYVENSIDCIAQLDESMYVTGGDSGALALWEISRKKPVHHKSLAHGLDKTQVDVQDKQPSWITAVASLRYSDLFFSGSWDGFVRVWKLATDNKSFEQIAEIPVEGVVNSIQVKTAGTSKRTLLIVGVGQELKLGRWIRMKNGVKNCTQVFELGYL